MTLIESGLRGFEKDARRRGREICVFQLLLGGGIKRDGAKRLRASPAVLRSNRDRLIKRTKRRRRRNFFQKLRGIFFAGPKFCEARSRGIAEVRLRETLDSFAVMAARARGISPGLGVAAKPIEGVA